jgi:putative intracellular protease/amidase
MPVGSGSVAEQSQNPDTKRVGIFVFDGFEPIDVWGFAEAFTISRFLGRGYASDPPYPFEVVLIAKELTKIKSVNGPHVMPDYTCAQALKEQFEVLMVPGGRGTWPLVDDPVVLDWLCDMDARVGLMTSVCTGAALLAKAGLLDGKPAATNHGAFGWVAQQGPRVLWDNVSRWVDAGRHVTSAGVSAGTDMGFYLVSPLAGRAVAEIAAGTAEYNWARDPQAAIFYPQQANVPIAPSKS